MDSHKASRSAKIQLLFSRIALAQGFLSLIYAAWSTWHYQKAHPIVWSCTAMLFVVSALLAKEAKNSRQSTRSAP